MYVAELHAQKHSSDCFYGIPLLNAQQACTSQHPRQMAMASISASSLAAKTTSAARRTSAARPVNSLIAGFTDAAGQEGDKRLTASSFVRSTFDRRPDVGNNTAVPNVPLPNRERHRMCARYGLKEVGPRSRRGPLGGQLSEHS